MRSLQQFWSVRRIGENRVTLARLGPLRLWLARAEMEWAFAFEYGDPSSIMDLAQVPEDVVPEGLTWKNIIFQEAPREYALQASLPDRPVVVKPAYPVSIPAGEAGSFYVLIPVFIRIALQAGRKEILLGSVPSRALSDTWFGTPTEGTLCYSLPLPAERDLESMEPLPHHVVCPLEVQNRSDEDLVFEKLCLRPRYVGLYSGNSHLWSSLVRIHHEGLFKSTTIRYAAGVPDREPNLLEILKPEKREDKGLQRLTFGSTFNRDIIFGK